MCGSGSTFATAQNLEQFLLWIRKTEILKQLSSESSPLCLLLILPPITPPSTGYGLPSPSSYVLSYAPTLAEPEGVCGAVPYGLCLRLYSAIAGLVFNDLRIDGTTFYHNDPQWIFSVCWNFPLQTSHYFLNHFRGSSNYMFLTWNFKKIRFNLS